MEITRNKSNKKIKKNKKLSSEVKLKRPIPPFFIFCSKFRKLHKEVKDPKKYSARELGDIWKEMTEIQKSPYINEYKTMKREYEIEVCKLKEQEKNFSDDEETTDQTKKKNKAGKTKAISSKIDIINNNKKPCNCGRCKDCKNRIKKKVENICRDIILDESSDNINII